MKSRGITSVFFILLKKKAYDSIPILEICSIRQAILKGKFD